MPQLLHEAVEKESRSPEKSLQDVNVISDDSVASEENSIYAEVRAAVPAVDEDVPVNTLRVWILGSLTTIIMAGITQLFQLHNSPMTMSAYVMILAVYPVGKLVSKVTPKASIHFMGRQFLLNPGPFSFKEHTIIAIMAIGSTGYDSGALATFVWTAMEKKLMISVSTGFKFLFLFTTQGIAFGLAGIFQKLLVDPAYTVWPTALPTCTLIHSMHNGNFLTNVESKWKMSPIRFFWLCFCAVVLWHVFPGFLFTGLSYFAWITWIYPDNVTVNQIFGAYSGMDLLPMTLDWNQIIAYQSSPLVTPAWAVLNVLGGAIFFIWIVSPALHWSNVCYGKYFPFSSSSIFDNTGNSYNTTRILNPDLTLNSTAYKQYSPIFLSTTSVLAYGLGFGAVTSVVVHVILHYRDEVWAGLKATLSGKQANANDDIHVKLMQKYKATPTWWYSACLVLITALSILFVEYFDTGMPWWGVILALAINMILFVPVAVLAAISNQGVSTNVLSEFIAGYLWPGKMVAVVIFKCISFNPLGSGLVLARDQKLGHYMKVPPRVVFCAQALGIIINWLVQTGVNIWALDNIDGICTTDAAGKFTCPISSSFKSTMVFWGLIGPSRLFSDTAMYRPLLWFFLIGALLPLVLYYAAKRYPRSGLRHVNVPLIFSSTAAMPPATAVNFMTWGIFGIMFQWYIRTRAFGWWQRYNFLLSAALDGGLAVTSLFIFFAFSYPGITLDWWGNNVDGTTADYAGMPLRTVSDGETFGPKSW